MYLDGLVVFGTRFGVGAAFPPYFRAAAAPTMSANSLVI